MRFKFLSQFSNEIPKLQFPAKRFQVIPMDGLGNNSWKEKKTFRGSIDFFKLRAVFLRCVSCLLSHIWMGSKVQQPLRKQKELWG